MKSLLDNIIDRLRNIARPKQVVWILNASDKSVTFKQGWQTITLSHSDFLLLRQLKEWQS